MFSVLGNLNKRYGSASPMNNSSKAIQSTSDKRGLLRQAIRCVISLLLLQTAAAVCSALPVSEYHNQLQRALGALTTLAQPDESETETNRAARIKETLATVRNDLPPIQTVEAHGTSINVDNAWLHRDLDNYEKAAAAERTDVLARIIERLQALEQRVAEIEKAAVANGDKTAAGKKLGEILKRSEYANTKPESALSRLWKDFWKWIQSFIPKPKIEPGRANFLGFIAQIFAIVLALGVLGYVIFLFAPRVFHPRRSKKKVKAGPRIVLGERLEPDQSALDLLAEA